MAISPRLRWPYPSEGVDPWYSLFQALVDAADATAFAGVEDRSLFVSGGGDFTFNASTGALAWDDDITINSPTTGIPLSVNSGSITLQDGQFVYVRMVRSVTSGATVLPIVSAFSLPVTDYDSALILWQRIGPRVYFRNGAILQDGDTEPVFEENSGGGGAGTVTSVTAGIGLSGGTITTAGTIDVVYGSGPNTACEGNDARLSNARNPTGAAGGSLAGTYPNPTIATIAGVAGTYSNPNLTVGSDGRVTNIASGPAPVTAVTASSPLASSGGTSPAISLSGTVPVANGGTGVASLLTNGVMLGGATVGTVSPGASGTVLTSDGTTWSAVAPTVPAYSVSSTLIGSAFNTNFISGGLSASLAAGTVTFTQVPAALTTPINATPYTINTASPARFFAIVGPAASNVVVNLPAANTVEDQFFYFKSFLVSGYSVSLTPNGADTIDGSASAFVFNQQYDSVLLESSSLGWSVVAAYLGTRTVQTFTSSGTWTKPANAKVVRVVAIGSGGGGGSGACGDNSADRSGGGGGGAGAISDETFAASDVPASLTVTVGAAGGGGGGVVGGFSGNPGSPGGATLVSDGATFYIQAAGGAGGGGGTTTSGTFGAAGATGYYTGTNGADGSIGSSLASSDSVRGCTGGGGGGGVTAAGGWGIGGNSGIPNRVLNYTNLQALGGTSVGGAGQAGISITVAAATIGSGGGGGAGNNTGAGNGGAGGFGGAAGGGGGGGGAARDSGYPPFNRLSGNGGLGGRGEVRIYTW